MTWKRGKNMVWHASSSTQHDRGAGWDAKDQERADAWARSRYRPNDPPDQRDRGRDYDRSRQSTSNYRSGSPRYSRGSASPDRDPRRDRSYRPGPPPREQSHDRATDRVSLQKTSASARINPLDIRDRVEPRSPPVRRHSRSPGRDDERDLSARSSKAGTTSSTSAANLLNRLAPAENTESSGPSSARDSVAAASQLLKPTTPTLLSKPAPTVSAASNAKPLTLPPKSSSALPPRSSNEPLKAVDAPIHQARKSSTATAPSTPSQAAITQKTPSQDTPIPKTATPQASTQTTSDALKLPQPNPSTEPERNAGKRTIDDLDESAAKERNPKRRVTPAASDKSHPNDSSPQTIPPVPQDPRLPVRSTSNAPSQNSTTTTTRSNEVTTMTVAKPSAPTNEVDKTTADRPSALLSAPVTTTAAAPNTASPREPSPLNLVRPPSEPLSTDPTAVNSMSVFLGAFMSTIEANKQLKFTQEHISQLERFQSRNPVADPRIISDFASQINEKQKVLDQQVATRDVNLRTLEQSAARVFGGRHDGQAEALERLASSHGQVVKHVESLEKKLTEESQRQTTAHSEATQQLVSQYQADQKRIVERVEANESRIEKVDASVNRTAADLVVVSQRIEDLHTKLDKAPAPMPELQPRNVAPTKSETSSIANDTVTKLTSRFDTMLASMERLQAQLTKSQEQQREGALKLKVLEEKYLAVINKQQEVVDRQEEFSTYSTQLDEHLEHAKVAHDAEISRNREELCKLKLRCDQQARQIDANWTENTAYRDSVEIEVSTVLKRLGGFENRLNKLSQENKNKELQATLSKIEATQVTMNSKMQSLTALTSNLTAAAKQAKSAQQQQQQQQQKGKRISNSPTPVSPHLDHRLHPLHLLQELQIRGENQYRVLTISKLSLLLCLLRSHQDGIQPRET